MGIIHVYIGSIHLSIETLAIIMDRSVYFLSEYGNAWASKTDIIHRVLQYPYCIESQLTKMRCKNVMLTFPLNSFVRFESNPKSDGLMFRSIHGQGIFGHHIATQSLSNLSRIRIWKYMTDIIHTIRVKKRFKSYHWISSLSKVTHLCLNGPYWYFKCTY